MNDANNIEAYLLGTLPSELVEQIEKRILTDDAFHEEVAITEEELLDSYVQGRMSEEKRVLFERHFLASPLRKQKLMFARGLQSKIDAIKTVPSLPRTRFPAVYPYALGACALALVALGIGTYRLFIQLEQQVDQVARLRAQIEEMRKTLAGASNPNYFALADRNLASQPLLVAKLLPGDSRGPGLPRISIAEGIVAVQFSLLVPKTVPSKTLVELLNDSGKVITSLRQFELHLVGNQRVVIATIRREYLNPGNYFLRVTSEQSPGLELRYPFQVSPWAPAR